jgi:hypothetical protein
MAIGCGANCAKIVLIIYNIIFLLTGLFLIGLGIWLIADGRVTSLINLTYNGTSSNLFRSAAILLITMGVLVVLISVLGFVGAILEHPIILGVYIGFLIIIFCGEIAGGVIAIVYKDRIIYSINGILQKSLNEQLDKNSTSHYYNEIKNNGSESTCYTSDVGYLWDFAQITFECCGLNDGDAGYSTKLSPAYNFRSMCSGLRDSYYPVSCYHLNDTAKFSDFHTNPDNQYAAQNLVDFNSLSTSGCSEKVTFWIERYAPVLIGIGIGFAMIEMFGIIFAVCLCQNVGDDD